MFYLSSGMISLVPCIYGTGFYLAKWQKPCSEMEVREWWLSGGSPVVSSGSFYLSLGFLPEEVCNLGSSLVLETILGSREIVLSFA
jgi:hypothetical protein